MNKIEVTKDDLSCSGYVCPNCGAYISYTTNSCSDCEQLINWKNEVKQEE